MADGNGVRFEVRIGSVGRFSRGRRLTRQGLMRSGRKPWSASEALIPLSSTSVVQPTTQNRRCQSMGAWVPIFLVSSAGLAAWTGVVVRSGSAESWSLDALVWPCRGSAGPPIGWGC